MINDFVLSQQDQPQIYHLAYTIGTSWGHWNHFFSWQSWFEVFKEILAKELTEAHCCSRYSCSKLLLIDAIYIWFSDEMLFTLTAPKFGEWHLVQ